MAEITYSTVHVPHEVLTWLCVVCYKHTCELHSEMAAFYCCVMAVFIGSATEERLQRVCCHGCCIIQESILLWLLYQPGGGLFCVTLRYGCCQKRINTSAVPTPPWVFFQPLNSWLPTYLAFPSLGSTVYSEMQQDNWPHEQDDQWYSRVSVSHGDRMDGRRGRRETWHLHPFLLQCGSFILRSSRSFYNFFFQGKS